MNEFSVLLSVYKLENPRFLENSIRSVSHQQTLKPSEIILVKDGTLNSELDKTIFTLKKEIPYLKVYGYEKNKGLGYALNFGLEQCTKELIFRMDTDDLALPKRFEIQLKHFLENSEISILGSKIEEFYQTPGDLQQFRDVPLTPEEIQKNKFRRNPFNHMTVLYKKSIVKEVGGYKDMPGYEDYYLWMRLLKKYNGMNLDKPLVFARIGNDMIKRRHGMEFFKKEFQFQSRLIMENLISPLNFSKNVIIRCFPRVLPFSILKIIYSKVLRK